MLVSTIAALKISLTPPIGETSGTKSWHPCFWEKLRKKPEASQNVDRTIWVPSMKVLGLPILSMMLPAKSTPTRFYILSSYSIISKSVRKTVMVPCRQLMMYSLTAQSMNVAHWYFLRFYSCLFSLSSRSFTKFEPTSHEYLVFISISG